jgi:hypothetical protein
LDIIMNFSLISYDSESFFLLNYLRFRLVTVGEADPLEIAPLDPPTVVDTDIVLDMVGPEGGC